MSNKNDDNCNKEKQQNMKWSVWCLLYIEVTKQFTNAISFQHATSNFFSSLFLSFAYSVNVFPTGVRPLKISCNTIFLMIFHEMRFFSYFFGCVPEETLIHTTPQFFSTDPRVYVPKDNQIILVNCNLYVVAL